MKKAIETKNDSRFNGRPIRVKKAVEARRLDKKKQRKEDRAASRDAAKEAAKEAADNE